MEFNKGNILNKIKEATKETVVMDEGLEPTCLKFITIWQQEYC